MGRFGMGFLMDNAVFMSLQLPDARASWRFFWTCSLIACVSRSVLWVALRHWVVGWAWGHAATTRLDDDLARELEGPDLLVSGHVSSMPAVDVDPRFDLDVVLQSEPRVPSNLLLAWYGTKSPAAWGARGSSWSD